MLYDLSEYALIDAQGADAEKYLQGQLTTDLSQLAAGENTLSVNCDPKGKVVSLFRLARLSSEQFYLIIRKDLLELGLANLKKYAVFSKITFTLLDAQIIGATENENLPDTRRIAFADRAILINLSSKSVEVMGSQQDWDLLEIQQGLPVLRKEMQNEFLPQALNLQQLEKTISFQKGCYIGQEMVARAKYRGANKRAMFTLTGHSSQMPALGSEVEMFLQTSWRKTGTVISALNIGGVLWLQVVMNKDIEPSQQFRLPADESSLCLYDLPYLMAS